MAVIDWKPTEKKVLRRQRIAVSLYLNGMPVSKIQKRFKGKTRATIYKYLWAANIPLRKYKKPLTVDTSLDTL